MSVMARSRNRILRIIQRNGAANVQVLSRELGLAPATIRRHVDVLLSDELITYELVRKATGRPEHSFSLTERGHESMPKGYGTLLQDLISDIASRGELQVSGKSGAELLRESFQRIGAAAGAEAPNAGQPIVALENLLEGRGFAPEIEKSATGFEIRLTNCPYRAAVQADPSVCAIDAALIQGVIGGEVSLVTCISEGSPCCVYAVSGAENGRTSHNRPPRPTFAGR